MVAGGNMLPSSTVNLLFIRCGYQLIHAFFINCETYFVPDVVACGNMLPSLIVKLTLYRMRLPVKTCFPHQLWNLLYKYKMCLPVETCFHHQLWNLLCIKCGCQWKHAFLMNYEICFVLDVVASGNMFSSSMVKLTLYKMWLPVETCFPNQL